MFWLFQEGSQKWTVFNKWGIRVYGSVIPVLCFVVYFCSTPVLFSCYILLSVTNYLCFYLLSYVFGYGFAYWLSDTGFGDMDAGLCACLRSHVVFGIFPSTIKVNWLYRCRENMPLPQSLYSFHCLSFLLSTYFCGWIWTDFLVDSLDLGHFVSSS